MGVLGVGDSGLEPKDVLREIVKMDDWLEKDYQKTVERLNKENKELKEKVRHYEMMYHNTGAMFNRMTMKEKIEEQQKKIDELKDICRGYGVNFEKDFPQGY